MLVIRLIPVTLTPDTVGKEGCSGSQLEEL